MSRGRLIAICGIDGAGKTTHEELLFGWLRPRIPVLRTQQPTSWYRQLPVVREYLDQGFCRTGMRGLALLAAADREHHLNAVIRPALAAGTWVLCNRYVYSTYAYFMARGVDLPFLRNINAHADRPDLTILLDLSAEASRRRVQERDGAIAKFEETRLVFMEAVRANFLAVRDDSFLVLDATLPASELHFAVRRAVASLNPPRELDDVTAISASP